MINNALNVNFAGNIARREVVKTSDLKTQKTESESINANKTYPGVSFKGWNNAISVQSKLQAPQDKEMYNQLSQFVGKENQLRLDNLLKNGKLISNKSNDGTSTLQNLYTIMTQPRVKGLDNKKVLIETLKTLENPMIINQNFGNIPDAETSAVLANEWFTTFCNGMGFDSNLSPHFRQAKYTGPFIAVNKEDLNIEYSGTCVASSIEFNLADRKPAEFARLVAGLTSPDMSAKVNLTYKDIANSKEEALEMLNGFASEYKEINPEQVEVVVRPDKNALVRAKLQQNRNDNTTRSLVDVVMQSTFMELGSANTYNSLLDKRNDEFITDGKGLAQFEVNYVENIVDNVVDGKVDKVSVVYQNVDDTGKVTSYNYDYNTTKKHLIDSLNSGENIVMGLTELDENNQIIGNSGHEITIIGKKEASDGSIIFIGNDSDDNYVGEIAIKEQDLIPKIHHAELSSVALETLQPNNQKDFQTINNFMTSKQ